MTGTSQKTPVIQELEDSCVRGSAALLPLDVHLPEAQIGEGVQSNEGADQGWLALWLKLKCLDSCGCRSGDKPCVQH